jgi:putative ABC transport system substrate-binding protein
MERRTFMALVSGGLLAVPRTGEAQPAGKVTRIGFLSPSSPSNVRNPLRLDALRQGLNELGYVEGQNIAIESRWAEGKYDQLPGLAADLVSLKVDVIVTYTAPAIQAVKQATRTIPIVMGGVIDPVATGLVASLARPGGNITGLSLMAAEPVAKQLEILKEAVPKVSRVAVLGNPSNVGTAPQLQYAQDAARALGMRLQHLEVRSPVEIDGAFTAMTRDRAGAVIVLVDAMFEEHRTRIVDLATRRHRRSHSSRSCRNRRRRHTSDPCDTERHEDDSDRHDRGRRSGSKRIGRELGPPGREHHRPGQYSS